MSYPGACVADRSAYTLSWYPARRTAFSEVKEATNDLKAAL